MPTTMFLLSQEFVILSLFRNFVLGMGDWEWGIEIAVYLPFSGHRPPGTEPRDRPSESQPRRREDPPVDQRNYASYTYAAGTTGRETG